MTEWTRQAVFDTRYSARPLAAFTQDPEPVAWIQDNPFGPVEASEVLNKMLREVRWRHHHGIPALKETSGFYASYSDRVDALLEAVEWAITAARIDVGTSSFIDIGAAEGYVTNHLYQLGVRDIDAVDLNEGNIRRMWMVRAAKGINPGRIGRIDLENVNWARALDRTYDVTLALGIVYHLENPLLFLRNLFAITDRAAVIESDTPVFPNNQRFRGNGVMYLHRDQVTLAQGDVRYLTEMRPDRQALIEMLLTAGFERVLEVPVPTQTPYHMFDSGEKTVLLALC